MCSVARWSAATSMIDRPSGTDAGAISEKFCALCGGLHPAFAGISLTRGGVWLR